MRTRSSASRAQFEADPALGLLQLRVDPLDGGEPPRDWVPRLRAGDRHESGEVTTVWEGAVAIPARALRPSRRLARRSSGSSTRGSTWRGG